MCSLLSIRRLMCQNGWSIWVGQMIVCGPGRESEEGKKRNRMKKWVKRVPLTVNKTTTREAASIVKGPVEASRPARWWFSRPSQKPEEKKGNGMNNASNACPLLSTRRRHKKKRQAPSKGRSRQMSSADGAENLQKRNKNTHQTQASVPLTVHKMTTGRCQREWK